MLCPDCRCAVPGGAPCPRCGQQAPDRESFNGQGGHYLRIMAAFAAIFALIFLFTTSRQEGLLTNLQRLYATGWLWFYFAIFLIPIGVGIYYWLMLREEEVIVTDEYIARRSHWGDERLMWAEVCALRRHPTPFRRTRLGRIAGLSRVLTDKRLFLDLPPVSYELVGPTDDAGAPTIMRLEPGTVEDMTWLLALVEERLEHCGCPSE